MPERRRTVRPPILISSAARSGTSLVAELVGRWGASGGDPQALRPPDEDNAHGYFEHRDLVRFLRELARAIESHIWEDDFADRALAKAHEPEWLDRARRLIAEMEKPGGVWFWKSPFLGPTLPLWEELCGGAVHVIPVRNPHSAALSWQHFSLPREIRDEVSFLAAHLARWQSMMLPVLEATERSPNKLFISYEDLVHSPLEQCRRLSDFLDAQYPENGRRPDRVEYMAEAVDPALQRSGRGVRLEEVPEATPALRALYALLLDKIDDPDKPFDPASCPLHPGWREYVRNVALFRRFAYQTLPVLRPGLPRTLLGVTRVLVQLARDPVRTWKRLRGADL